MSVTCCHEGCSAPVCFADGVEDRLRRTHEWWCCPFGHQQHFSAETDQEKRHRVELEREKRAAATWRRIAEDRAESFGTCPFGCGWRSLASHDRMWLQMFKHFSKVHGNLLPHAMVYRCRRENWPGRYRPC